MTIIEKKLTEHIKVQIADEIFLKYSELVKCDIVLIEKEFFVTASDVDDNSTLFRVKVENGELDIRSISNVL